MRLSVFYVPSMKNTFQYLTLLAGLSAGVLMADTAAPATEAQAPAVTAQAASVVGDYLNQVTFLTGKPMEDAQYYIYLYSASWCPPCRALMPSIVKLYPTLKENKVEIILVSCDSNDAEAKKYVEHYNAGVPGLHAGSAAARKRPGTLEIRSIPSAIFVDAQGNVIKAGSGRLILEWEKILKPQK